MGIVQKIEDKLSGHKNDDKTAAGTHSSTHPTGTHVPGSSTTGTSGSYATGATGTSGSYATGATGTTGTQSGHHGQTSSSSGQHHYGRDAGVVGGGAVGAHELEKHHREHQAGQTGQHGQTSGSTGQHHYGRDAGVVGAGAVGAHELEKHHHERQAGQTGHHGHHNQGSGTSGAYGGTPQTSQQLYNEPSANTGSGQGLSHHVYNGQNQPAHGSGHHQGHRGAETAAVGAGGAALAGHEHHQHHGGQHHHHGGANTGTLAEQGGLAGSGVPQSTGGISSQQQQPGAGVAGGAPSAGGATGTAGGIGVAHKVGGAYEAGYRDALEHVKAEQQGR